MQEGSPHILSLWITSLDNGNPPGILFPQMMIDCRQSMYAEGTQVANNVVACQWYIFQLFFSFYADCLSEACVSGWSHRRRRAAALLPSPPPSAKCCCPSVAHASCRRCHEQSSPPSTAGVITRCLIVRMEWKENERKDEVRLFGWDLKSLMVMDWALKRVY